MSLRIPFFALTVLLAAPSPSFALDEAQLCAAAKLKAAGKTARRLLSCHARAARRGTQPESRCLGSARETLATRFARAELKATRDGGQCRVENDAAAVAAEVDGFVGDAISALRPRSGASPCAARKLTGAGKAMDGLLAAHSIAIRSGTATDLTTRLAKVERQLATSFTRAETRKSDSCLTSGDLVDVELEAWAHLRGVLSGIAPCPPFDCTRLDTPCYSWVCAFPSRTCQARLTPEASFCYRRDVCAQPWCTKTKLVCGDIDCSNADTDFCTASCVSGTEDGELCQPDTRRPGLQCDCGGLCFDTTAFDCQTGDCSCPPLDCSEWNSPGCETTGPGDCDDELGCRIIPKPDKCPDDQDPCTWPIVVALKNANGEFFTNGPDCPCGHVSMDFSCFNPDLCAVDRGDNCGVLQPNDDAACEQCPELFDKVTYCKTGQCLCIPAPCASMPYPACSAGLCPDGQVCGAFHGVGGTGCGCGPPKPCGCGQDPPGILCPRGYTCISRSDGSCGCDYVGFCENRKL